MAALRDVSAEVVTKGRALHAALRSSSYGSLLAGLAACLLLGFTPAAARIIAWVAQPFGGHWLAEAVLGGLVILLLLWLVSLPFGAWRHTVLGDYGLSTQNWRGWAVDQLKGGAVGLVTGAVVCAGFYTLTRFAPGWWWAFGAVGAAALVVLLLSFVFPVLVEPVFNTFTPMPSGPLRQELVMMAARDGMPVRDVLDASRRTTGLNAYVSGFGAAAAVVALCLLGQWDALLRRAGVDSIGSPRAIGLVLAVAALAGLVTAPVQNLISRRVAALSRAVEFCPEAVVKPARRRSRELPGGGHGICPALATIGRVPQLKGLTP